MKEKLAKASSREKLQILTLVPELWSLRKVGKEFGVSKTTVFKARKLRDQKGIIKLPEKCRKQKISNKIIQLVQEFYCNNEFSRQVPGKKDYVKVVRNQHMSKRLILCNLKELYVKLMLDAVGLESEYHNLIATIVCSRDSKICMIRRCKKCPGLKELEQYF